MQRIKRDIYLQRLIDREQNGLVKIISGIRRYGKSYLLNTIVYGYLNTANYRFLRMTRLKKPSLFVF